MEDIDCYQEVLSTIKSDPNQISSIESLRGSKRKGNYDPIHVTDNLRVIDFSELQTLITKSEELKCLNTLSRKRKFLGLRFINKNAVIFEIDRFKSTTSRLSNYQKTEFHRIVNDSGSFYLDKIIFKGEKIIFEEALSKDLKYVITKVRHPSIVNYPR